MPEFRLSPAAQNDLEGIFEYTVERWGLDQAIRYIEALEKTCTALAESPDTAQDCDHIRPGYLRSPVGRHFIYFRAEDFGIAVIRILHQHMDQSRHL